MHDIPVIRRLQPADREAVRRLCGDTADSGDPIERVFSDRELLVDAMTRYYTDFEPAFSWVADAGGRLAGYVLAAADTEAADRVARLHILPGALGHAILRGALLRAETWRMLIALGANLRVFASRRAVVTTAYPAHVHINLDARFRSQGMGGRLLDAALKDLHAGRAAGVHASVRADSPRACRFFESHGFAVVHRGFMTFPVKGGVTQREVLLYGLSFAGNT